MPSDSRLTTFLFDLDGTLLDSIELIFRSYRHTLKQHRGIDGTDDMWLEALGRPLRVQLGQFSDDATEIEAMVATYREFNFAHHDSLARPYEGVIEQIHALHDAGNTLGVVTSKLRDGALRGLRLMQIEDCFDFVVGADDVLQAKPHPEPVLRALELAQSAAAEAVMIGDSPHDLACGRAAGVRTAAVLWGPFPRGDLERYRPDYWLESPKDIAQLATPA